MAAPLSSDDANPNLRLETDAGVLAGYLVGQREELGLEPVPSCAFGALVIAAFKIEKIVAVVHPSGLHAWV